MGSNPTANRYKTAGIVLMIAGLLFNPWLLAWLSGSKFSLTVFTGILLGAIVMTASGAGFFFRKNEFIHWLTEKYQDFAVIVLNVMILFILMNIFAALMIKNPEEGKSVKAGFYSPQELFRDSVEFMRMVYPGKSDEDIGELLMLTSPYANHPVLEFQERIQTSEHYNTGFEGIRFDKKVTGKNAATKINGAVWVFGGSTTFGQGVSDNETIPAWLNQLDTSATYVNFGVHAYHQSNEIEKLMLLLKKGYQPGKVIFIDGLNDLIRMIETNFHPLETPALAKSAYTSDYNIATKEPEVSFLKLLPVTRWLRSFMDESGDEDIYPGLPWDKYDDVYHSDNLYNTDPRQHFLSTIRRSPYAPVDSAGLKYVVWKLSAFYSANYRFIEKLSQAYGFEFSVFYQPIGVLSEDNPFWRDQTSRFQDPLYRNVNFIVPEIRSLLAQWNLPGFIDISGVQDSCPDCYVDLTHYNRDLNRKIAEAILSASD